MCHDIERGRDKAEKKRWPTRGGTEERQDFLKHSAANLTTVWKVSAGASNRVANKRSGRMHCFPIIFTAKTTQVSTQIFAEKLFFHTDTKSNECWLWTFEDVELKSTALFFSSFVSESIFPFPLFFKGLSGNEPVLRHDPNKAHLIPIY